MKATKLIESKMTPPIKLAALKFNVSIFYIWCRVMVWNALAFGVAHCGQQRGLDTRSRA